LTDLDRFFNMLIIFSVVMVILTRKLKKNTFSHYSLFFSQSWDNYATDFWWIYQSGNCCHLFVKVSPGAVMCMSGSKQFRNYGILGKFWISSFFWNKV